MDGPRPGGPAPGARVEGLIRTGKDTGPEHLPSQHEQLDTIWTLMAADHSPQLHRAPTQTLRDQLLHNTGRRARGQWKTFGPGRALDPRSPVGADEVWRMLLPT